MQDPISNQQGTLESPSRSDFMSDLESDPVITAEPGSPESEEVVEIDERFADLNISEEEKRFRTLKSKYDKLYTTNEKVLRESELSSKAKEFFNQLESDDELLEAYLNERKPELLSKRDISTIVKEKLNAEFQEFAEKKPSRSDADEDPGGRAWLYYKRLDELYNELKGGNKKAATVKELREQRKLERESQEGAIVKQIEDLKVRMNLDDNFIDGFNDWRKKVDLEGLMKVYKSALLTQRLPSAAQMSGRTTTPNVQGARKTFLETL